MSSKHTREPPEGVLAGEDVPPQNDREQLRAGLVRELAKKLGERPGYCNTAYEKRLRAARERLWKWGGN